MTQIKIYNSLTRKKGGFIPIDPAHIRVYACGPTVYSYAHIGNARMAVVFDLLVKVLRQKFDKVTYVSNITDVDDKIIAAGAQSGEEISTITRRYERIYNEDMAALGVTAPDIQPRATTHIGDMIALISALIENGHAYEAKNHVLFHVPSFKAYGTLSGRNRDEQVAGARVEVAPFKKDPADFVLWKPSESDQPGWDSPWGRGRPGWHIECSAMAEKHLGLPFDIHGGGADLKFPHHENEIAQSCCAHGKDEDAEAFARYWVHNGFVTVAGEKMAKSVGNIRLVHDLVKNYKGEVLRLALLSAHYRQPLDWSEEMINAQKAFLDSLYRTLFDLKDIPAQDAAPDQAVMAALSDDLNTPQALAELKQVARRAAHAETAEDKAAMKAALIASGAALGLLQEDPAMWLGYNQAGDDIDVAWIEGLLKERQEARKAKNYARSDEIRDELAAKDITIEDTPDGPKWRRSG